MHRVGLRHGFGLQTTRRKEGCAVEVELAISNLGVSDGVNRAYRALWIATSISLHPECNGLLGCRRGHGNGPSYQWHHHLCQCIHFACSTHYRGLHMSHLLLDSVMSDVVFSDVYTFVVTKLFSSPKKSPTYFKGQPLFQLLLPRHSILNRGRLRLSAYVNAQFAQHSYPSSSSRVHKWAIRQFFGWSSSGPLITV